VVKAMGMSDVAVNADGVRETHEGLKTSWQRCRVHFIRNAPDSPGRREDLQRR
jgi:hypothetical protein